MREDQLFRAKKRKKIEKSLAFFFFSPSSPRLIKIDFDPYPKLSPLSLFLSLTLYASLTPLLCTICTLFHPPFRPFVHPTHSPARTI